MSAKSSQINYSILFIPIKKQWLSIFYSSFPSYSKNMITFQISLILSERIDWAKCLVAGFYFCNPSGYNIKVTTSFFPSAGILYVFYLHSVTFYFLLNFICPRMKLYWCYVTTFQICNIHTDLSVPWTHFPEKETHVYKQKKTSLQWESRRVEIKAFKNSCMEGSR